MIEQSNWLTIFLRWDKIH